LLRWFTLASPVALAIGQRDGWTEPFHAHMIAGNLLADMDERAWVADGGHRAFLA